MVSATEWPSPDAFNSLSFGRKSPKSQASPRVDPISLDGKPLNEMSRRFSGRDRNPPGAFHSPSTMDQEDWQNEDLLSPDENEHIPATSFQQRSEPVFRSKPGFHREPASRPYSSFHQSAETDSRFAHEAEPPLPPDPSIPRDRSPSPAESHSTFPVSEHNRLIIAIDYGTTYTGVGYSVPKSGVASLADLDIVSNWGPGMDNHEKIPSVISYSPKASFQDQQWGTSISEEGVTMVHTKLELDVQESKQAELESLIHTLDGMKNLDYHYIKQSKGRPQFTWKSPEAIVTDYLTKVFEAFTKYLAGKRKLGEASTRLFQTVPVDIIITIPVDWSYQARNATFRAIRRAGFNDDKFLRLENVVMIKEPVAAALFVVRELKDARNEIFLAPGSSFVLCDAGGGTVDVVSYKVMQIEPKLELKQIGDPSCKKCGSIYIDMNFKEWLRDLVGQRNWQTLDPKSTKGKISAQTSQSAGMRKIMKAFDVYKRRFFDDDENREIKIRLPAPLENANIKGIIVDGELTIPRKDMQEFFGSCIDGTIELILNQIEQAEMEQTRVKNIIMVGGFAESKYLQSEIELALETKGGITLRLPEKSWTAVVRGATMYGIENDWSQSSLKPCPTNFGIRLDEGSATAGSSIDSIRPGQPIRRAIMSGQMSWLILKDDLLLPDEPIKAYKDCTFTFKENEQKKLKFPIYEYTDYDVPKRFQGAANELETVLTLDIDLSEVPNERFQRSEYNGRYSYTVVLVCEMIFTFKHALEVHMLWETKEGEIVAEKKKDMRRALSKD